MTPNEINEHAQASQAFEVRVRGVVDTLNAIANLCGYVKVTPTHAEIIESVQRAFKAVEESHAQKWQRGCEAENERGARKVLTQDLAAAHAHIEELEKLIVLPTPEAIEKVLLDAFPYRVNGETQPNANHFEVMAAAVFTLLGGK